MNDSPEMMRLLDKIHSGQIACLGDLMLDRYVYGAVERICICAANGWYDRSTITETLKSPVFQRAARTNVGWIL